MDQRIADLVAHIHAAPLQLTIAATGAGSQAIAWLLGIPGASQTVLEALVPYGRAALQDYLGFTPEHYASAATALAMAAHAYDRTAHYQEHPGLLAGIGCAAAIASVPPRRGSHRAAVAVWDTDGHQLYELTLQKGRRDRYGEELLVSRLILQAIADAAGLAAGDLCQCGSDEIRVERRVPLRQQAEKVLSGAEPLLLMEANGTTRSDSRGCALVLPGSFNPLHYGHRRLAVAASTMLGVPACFEIAVRNADKPALRVDALLQRLRQFAGYAPVAVTAVPLFVDKANLFPGATFVIGADTALRLVEPRYYGGVDAMHAAFGSLHSLECRFLVAGRLVAGRFMTLDDIAMPDRLRPAFIALPPDLFRADISSSDLRTQASAPLQS